ncbi:hypothetical protein HK096_005119, partial [Nowakowskiella sp. JEL0078]
MSFAACGWAGTLALILSIAKTPSAGIVVFVIWGCGTLAIFGCGVFFFNWLYERSTRTLYKKLMSQIANAKETASTKMLNQSSPILQETSNFSLPTNNFLTVGGENLQRAYSTNLNFNSHISLSRKPESNETQAQHKKIQLETLTIGVLLNSIQTIRFVNPTFVEVRTRFLVDTQNPSKNELLVAEAIYHHALNQFDKSPQMFLQIGIYYGLYKNEAPAWKFYLNKALDSSPPFDVELAIKLSDLERRRKSQEEKGQELYGQMDIVDQVELKVHLKSVKKITNDLEDLSIQLWRTLMLNKVDTSKLEKITQKIAANEEMGYHLFDILLERFRDNMMILDAYGQFLDVSEHYTLGDKVYNRIDQLTPIGEDIVYHLSETSLGGGLDKQIRVEEDYEKNKSMSNLSSKNVGINRRRPKSLGRAQINERAELRRLIKTIRNNVTKRLSLVLKFFILVILSLALSQLFWCISAMDRVRSQLNDIVLGGMRREIALEIPLLLRQMQFAVKENDILLFNISQERIFNQTQVSFIIQNHLFFGADETQPSYQLWLKPWIKLMYWLSGEVSSENRYWDNPLNEYDSTSEFWRHGKAAANHSMDFYVSKDFDIDESVRFTLDNDPFTLANAYNEATFGLTLEDEGSVVLLTT